MSLLVNYGINAAQKPAALTFDQIVNYDLLYDLGTISSLAGGMVRSNRTDVTESVILNANNVRTRAKTSWNYSVGFTANRINLTGYKFVTQVSKAIGTTNQNAFAAVQNTNDSATFAINQATGWYHGKFPLPDLTNKYYYTTNLMSFSRKFPYSDTQFQGSSVTPNINLGINYFVAFGGTGCCGTGVGFETYNLWLSKVDDWQQLATYAGLTPANYTDEIELAYNQSAIEAIFNDQTTLNFMTAQCTGSFMTAAIQSQVFRNVLNASPNGSVVTNNFHWNKFLNMGIPVPV
jgi:hypothetical protein